MGFNSAFKGLMNCTTHQILFGLSKRKEWGMRNVIIMGDRKCANTFTVGKRKGKKPRGRQRRKWEDNIKIDFQEVGSRGMD
jgi:hypothetical protein